MTLTVRLNGCQGHGVCYGLSPPVFAPDEAGFAQVIELHPDADAREALEEAVLNCPEAAISVAVEA